MTIENPYSTKGQLDEKMHIVDVKARDDKGRTFQIELQLTSPNHLPSRMLHNLCQIHGNQIKSGDLYNKVMPTISIWLLTNDIKFDNDYEINHGDVKFHFTLCDIDKGARISQDISLYIVNLHRWQKPQHLSEEDYWLYFLNEASHWTKLPTDAQIPQLQEAMQVLEEFSEKEESFLVYQSRLAAYTAAISEEAERQQMAEEKQQMAEENQQMAEENKRLKQAKKLANQQLNLAKQEAEQQIIEAERKNQQLIIGLLNTTDMDIEQIAKLSGI